MLLCCYCAWNGRCTEHLSVHLKQCATIRRSLSSWNSLPNVGCLGWWLCWFAHCISLGHKSKLWQEKSRLQFLGCRWCYWHGHHWTWDHHQLRALHCNAQNFETIRKSVDTQHLLQHDNARPYILQTTAEAVEKLDLTIPWHLPYRQDLATYNFHFFYKLTETPHGHLYDSDEGVERSVRTWRKKQIVEFFRDSFEKLVRLWQKCVESDGVYVEK